MMCKTYIRSLFSLRHAIFGAVLTLMLALAPAIQAMQPALPVNWPQNSISWNQLQALMAGNPGYNQFNIRFPNGFVWNADAGTVQNLYNAYTQHAQTLGYAGNNIPALVFSSLNNASRLTGGAMTVPLNRITQASQSTMQNIMNQLDYEKYHLASYLPDWLKNIIVMICNGFSILFDTMADEFHQWFD
ncbi:MAG TPA: hypothetical protein VFT64_07270 [Rickettsiales bacterium]|nr:hypothetical protein [Rickettsiales bacterium]